MTAPPILLIGSIGAGKTTFRQQLMGQEVDYAKTQAMEAFDGIIDTPGEYLEYGRFQRALHVAACDVDTIVLMIDPTSADSRIPPGSSADSTSRPSVWSPRSTWPHRNRSRRRRNSCVWREPAGSSASTR